MISLVAFVGWLIITVVGGQMHTGEGQLTGAVTRGLVWPFLLQAFRRTVSIWPAVALTTLAFGAIHILNVFMTGEPRAALIQSAAAALTAPRS